MADKLLLKATTESMEGDQELSYILYMRFVDVVKVVTGSKEYKKDKTELSKLLPTRRITEALTKAETLSSCLEQRYAGTLVSECGLYIKWVWFVYRA